MQKLGKYTLVERVATGGMAELFRATIDGGEGFTRTVAIKRILPELVEDEQFVRMFIDEAKIAVQLSHGNIAQILDLACEDDQYYIAMEFIDGHDLRQVAAAYLKRYSTGVPVPIAMHVVMRVAEALAYAHNARTRSGDPLCLIHRDVSPHNILISRDGEVKVIDFGLAKAAGRVVQTQAGIVKGKLAYMSPEQARGEEIDHRSDIYALGICLYEILAGAPLFYRRNDVDTILAVQSGDVPPLLDLAPETPRGLAAITMRMLAYDRDVRYPQASEVFDDLEALAYELNAITSQQVVSRFLADLFDESTADDAIAAPAAAPVARAPSPMPPPPERQRRPSAPTRGGIRRPVVVPTEDPDDIDADGPTMAAEEFFGSAGVQTDAWMRRRSVETSDELPWALPPDKGGSSADHDRASEDAHDTIPCPPLVIDELEASLYEGLDQNPALRQPPPPSSLAQPVAGIDDLADSLEIDSGMFLPNDIDALEAAGEAAIATPAAPEDVSESFAAIPIPPISEAPTRILTLADGNPEAGEPSSDDS